MHEHIDDDLATDLSGSSIGSSGGGDVDSSDSDNPSPLVEESDLIVCETCEVELKDTDKFCPECGTISEIGRATEALRTLGDPDEPDWGMGIMDTLGSMIIGMDSSPSYGNTTTTSNPPTTWSNNIP